MHVCPACGSTNPPTAEYCMACGSALTDGRAPGYEERKTVTVVFCDVEGSTTLGDRLDPESLRQVMLRFFQVMRAVLESHGGTVGKYIGDAVMAVFGVPRRHEDDALRAVRAASEMQAALERLNAELDRRFGVRLRTRTGVNTGEVVVGDEAAGEALVLGDSVNVAARLEQVAPVGGILIGTETYALVRDHVAAEPVEPLDLKGKPEPVHAYRLVEAPARGAVLGRPDHELVGREVELARVRAAFERSAAGREPLLMTILGPAGIGKSRLSRELRAQLGDRALVLAARCLPYGDGVTFLPAADLVKQACGVLDEDGPVEARAKVDAAVHGADDATLISHRLDDLMGIGDGTTELQETFWAIRRLLEWVGRTRPVFAILDDLQWAEPTLLDLIEYLGGWTRDTPLFLLCLARPDLLDLRPEWGAASTASLSLGPLDQAESERLVGSILRGARIDAPLTQRISEAAGGNPLFVEEMLRMLEDDGLLRRSDGAWAVTGDLSAVAVPASIHALLGARLDRLSDDERAVVRCAAVPGQMFWWGAVAELVPARIRPDVGAHLQTLVRKDLIRPDRSTIPGEDAFHFHHVLVQEAAYRSIPKELRAELHARFADWVERAGTARTLDLSEIVGHHLAQAVGYRAELGAPAEVLRALGLRAARALGLAGRRALERRDMAAAADLLGRAAEIFPSDVEERRDVLLPLAEALVETGDLAAAEARLDEADALATAAADRGMLADAAVLRLNLLESTDPSRFAAEAESGANALIAALEELGNDAGLARAWRLVGDLQWARSRYAAADEALARAVEHARRAGDAREEAECLGRYVGSGAYGPVHIREVERRCEELLASSASVAGREAPALRALAVVRAMEGRFEEARELAARARATLEEFGLRLRASWVSETAGAVEMLAGDPVAAETELRSGFDAAVELGERGFQATVAALLAHALIEQDRLDDAERFAAITESAASEDDLASQVLWRSARARILAGTAQADEAAALAGAALGLVERSDDVNMHADTLVDAGVVFLVAGHPDQAVAAFDEAITRYDQKGNVVSAKAARRRRQAVASSAR